MTGATCLIKGSKNSSYGALSKAGMEYSTYLSCQRQQDQNGLHNSNAMSQCGNLTSQCEILASQCENLTSSPPMRPHSVYAGLSYVPFNYCDDLKIEDIFRHFKQKQETKRHDWKKRNRNARRRSITNLPLVRSMSEGNVFCSRRLSTLENFHKSS